MVKKFNEFIDEKYNVKQNISSSEDTPDCLLKIIEYLNSYSLNINKDYIDGRVGSIKDEDSCIEALRKSDEFITINEVDFEGVNFDDKIYIVVPKIRDWYDIRVIYNKKNYYINIKSSSLKTPDNVGCIDAIIFGLFGKFFKDKNKDKKYAKLFHEYNNCCDNGFDSIEEFDYYFLVINKNDKGRCFITSLCHMNNNSIQSNGSNLPFQCKWLNNSNKKSKKEDVCNLIMDVIFNSLIKSVDIFNMEPLRIYIDRHKKKVSIPLWED